MPGNHFGLTFAIGLQNPLFGDLGDIGITYGPLNNRSHIARGAIAESRHYIEVDLFTDIELQIIAYGQ
jgi:hypothetical protein